jgi:hypothetical protein
LSLRFTWDGELDVDVTVATGMSAYGPFYNESELWSLAAFVRRINALSAAEIKRYNQRRSNSEQH